MSVNMLQTLHDLEQDALDTPSIKTFVVAGLHKLIKITIHILHTNMEFLAERVEKNI